MQGSITPSSCVVSKSSDVATIDVERKDIESDGQLNDNEDQPDIGEWRA